MYLLPDTDGSSLLSHTLHVLKDEELGLAEGCIPDRRAIRPLLRFKAAAPNWKLEFNRNSLRSGDVIYNRNNDTIVLYNIPDTLKRELQADSGS